MRKNICILVLILCFIATSAYAGGSGNPIQPLKNTTDHMGMGVGFGYNYVQQRMNKLYCWEDDVKDVEVNRLSQIYGTVPVGINKNLNIIGKVGGSYYDLKFKEDDTDETIEVDLNGGIYAGVGLNGLFPMEEWLKDWENFTISIGFDVQASGCLNDVKGVTRAGAGTSDESGSVYGADGQESVYIACKYDIEKIKTSIIPYVGAYHSWIVRGTLDDISYTQNKIESSHSFFGAFDALSFGVLVGLDVEVTKYMVFNVEGRFVGETAITTGATIKF